MESRETLTITAVAWSQAAAECLAAVGNASNYRKQVEQGAALFEVREGAALAGYYLLRVDQTEEGPEGVLVAGVGRAGADLTANLFPIIEKQFIGCVSMRVHTARPGLIRKLSRRAYEPVEFVLRKKL